ncbi:TrkH family potassium uptake protein [Micromonospora sp. RTP1Z1]|uniref:TrkH family potassium uptake protein n=1 Tax=Micromonospora sp. RTP1Z1 TaxID=2994043 RepID=UPI0029C631A8|nr:potassium transporter TrkG [Micromonospora sp. RTP1Z1]
MRQALQNPVRIVPLTLLAAIGVGTAVMMLPVSRRAGHGAPFLIALDTATSSVCTAGLDLVETSTYWSGFGHVAITVLTQLGGFGIMAMALLLLLTVSRELGLRNRLVLQAEGAGIGIGETRRTLLRIATTMLIWESAIAVMMAGRLWLHYHYPLGRAAWFGVFHGVQAFNNSGFTLFESWDRFIGDPWMCLPPTIGVIIGSLGFPVLFELRHTWRRHERWSVHTRLTVWGSLILLVVGFLSILLLEWSNSRTLGRQDVPTKLLASFVQGTIPRSGGFNTFEYGDVREETSAIVTALMFIGGGSASTAGGIKVTTFFLLAYVIWAEVRGEPDVVMGHRRIASVTQRQALTIALLGVALVSSAALLMMGLTSNVRFYRALFEVTSAFSTAGIATDITPTLPQPVQYLLIILLFVGRVGTIAAASALALRTRHRLYRYPEERPIVG